jgi:hypothetical protein
LGFAIADAALNGLCRNQNGESLFKLCYWLFKLRFCYRIGFSMAKKVRLMNTKETVTFRLTKSVKRRLKQAVRHSDLNMSQYVEQAIEARLARDEIRDKPDFRKHFAEHPLLPGGDRVMRSLLLEREDSL